MAVLLMPLWGLAVAPVVAVAVVAVVAVVVAAVVVAVAGDHGTMKVLSRIRGPNWSRLKGSCPLDIFTLFWKGRREAPALSPAFERRG